MREWARKKAAEKAKGEPQPRTRKARRIPDPEIIEQRVAEIKKRRYEPEYIEVVDDTGMGLEKSITKRGKTITVRISCGRGDQDIIKMEIKRIRETYTEGTVDTS
jgi:hypothetical protein